MNYCLGFVFSLERDQVLLLKKARPDWQAGLFNGVGGKVEKGEYSQDAMVREFEEETGVSTDLDDWEFYVSMQNDDWKVDCYFAFMPIEQMVEACRNSKDSDEPCKMFPIRSLQDCEVVLSNLKWLVPMALDEINYKVKV